MTDEQRAELRRLAEGVLALLDEVERLRRAPELNGGSFSGVEVSKALRQVSCVYCGDPRSVCPCD